MKITEIITKLADNPNKHAAAYCTLIIDNSK